MKPRIAFHTGAPCNGCPGIGDHWRGLNAAGIPFGVYSVEGGGLIAEAAQLAHADPLIYRTLATDVPAYELPPNEAAARSWSILMERIPPEMKALRERVWIEVGNEQAKARADWLGWYYVELAGYALANGYRLVAFGWSTGEPEPAHWESPGILAYLKLCAANPARLAVSVHEYSLSADDIMAGYPWLVGRVQFLFDACDKHKIARPVVFVTEAGWTHNDLPHADKAKADIAALAELYATYPTVKAAFLWTLIGGGDKKTLAVELNALMPWLAEYTIATTFPDADPPPDTEPPTIPMSNLLFNPSFELDWHDAADFPGHIPDGWTVRYNFGAAYPNPYGQPYKNGEAVKKHRGNLPPDEQAVFVWDGDWTYKVFGGGTKSFWFEMSQTVTAPAGDYEIAVPVWVDHYHWHGYKNYDVDPNQAQVMIVANGVSTGRVSVQSGGRREVAYRFAHGGGPLAVTIHLISNWDINGNFWIDGLSLSPVTVAPPVTPEKHRAVIVLLPQDVTADEMATCAREAHKNLHTMTPSHDDALTMLNGGNSESYAKIYRPSRQLDRVALIEAAGYGWEEFLPAPAPLIADTFRSPVGTAEERERGDLWAGG